MHGASEVSKIQTKEMNSHHESECLAPAEDPPVFISPFVSPLITSTKFALYCTVLKRSIYM